MTVVKTSELTGKQLDWAVAKCEKVSVGVCLGGYLALRASIKASPYSARGYSPSTDWCQGGPIIEREHITVGPHTYGPASVILAAWKGIILFDPDSGQHVYEEDGPTPLIAAMRCYVASKLGDTVKVPNELGEIK